MADPCYRVACAADANYLPHAATLIRSLAAAHPAARVHVTLLHDASVNPEMRERLAAFCVPLGVALDCVQPTPEQLAPVPPAGRYPALIWYRLLLPELIPDAQRLLYLDADTVVLDELGPLFATPLQGHALAAARAPATHEGAEHLAALGLRADFPYFNSGVLLMDLARMRADGFAERVLAVAREYGERLRFPDQDALNLACGGDWPALHPRWNALAWFFLDRADALHDPRTDREFAEACAAPGILHFEGSALAKPWHARCLHPHRSRYLAFRADTPWPLIALEGASLRASLLRALPLGLQLRIARMRRAALPPPGPTSARTR